LFGRGKKKLVKEVWKIAAERKDLSISENFQKYAFFASETEGKAKEKVPKSVTWEKKGGNNWGEKVKSLERQDKGGPRKKGADKK